MTAERFSWLGLAGVVARFLFWFLEFPHLDARSGEPVEEEVEVSAALLVLPERQLLISVLLL